MIVYAETNFILELAFLREECEHCEDLAQRAQSGEIELVLPAFCGGEPYESMIRRSRKRKSLHDELATEIKELSRSSPYSNIAEMARTLTVVLSQSASEEKDRIDNTLLRLTKISRLIPLTSDVLALSIAHQTQFALSPQDAIVFASIITDLETQNREDQKLFVTQNKSDFLNPDIGEVLSAHWCKLLFRFSDAVGYVTSIARRSNDNPASPSSES